MTGFMAGEGGGGGGADKYPLEHSEIFRGQITESFRVEFHPDVFAARFQNKSTGLKSRCAIANHRSRRLRIHGDAEIEKKIKLIALSPTSRLGSQQPFDRIPIGVYTSLQVHLG